MTTNQKNGTSEHTVSVDREEYDALRALRDEHFTFLTAAHAKLQIANQELVETVKSQVARIALLDVRCTGLEQLVLLRREIVSASGTEFRVEMRIATAKMPSRPSIDAIVKQMLKTPDVTDVAIFDHLNRRLHPEFHASEAEAQAYFEAAGPKKQAMLQTHLIHQLQGDNVKLHAELEASKKELEKIKADALAGATKQEGKKP